MRGLISFRETTEVAASTTEELRDAVALRFDPTRRVMLRFQLVWEDADELEALRYARRAMVREERLRGLEWDEPSMEDPTLTGAEFRWYALVSQAAWCRQKMAQLVERANQALTSMHDGEN